LEQLNNCVQYAAIAHVTLNRTTDDVFLTTEEVLEYLHVNLRTVYRLIKAGKIPAVRVGRQWRFRRADLDAWLDNQRTSRAGETHTGEGRHKVLVVDDEEGIRDLLSRTLAYSASLVGEIADDLVSIDRAMRWGFNWELGPFETWDALGVAAAAERMQRDGVNVPAWVREGVIAGPGRFYAGTVAAPTFFDVPTRKPKPIARDPRELKLDALSSDPKRVVKKNLGASLIDLGDGALCVEVHTKMNTLDGDVIEMLVAGVNEAERNFEALVIGNDGLHFGAGALALDDEAQRRFSSSADHDRRCRRALPIHRGAWRQQARPMPRSCARTKRAPPLPRPGLAAGHRLVRGPGLRSRVGQRRLRPDGRAVSR